MSSEILLPQQSQLDADLLQVLQSMSFLVSNRLPKVCQDNLVYLVLLHSV